MKKTGLLLVIWYALSNIAFGQTKLIMKTIIGGEGGWDYLSVNAQDRQLYLSHSNQVEVLNVDTHEKIGVIPDTKGVHGIVAVAELGKGFITSGRTNSVIVFDTKTLAKLSEISLLQSAILFRHGNYLNCYFFTSLSCTTCLHSRLRHFISLPKQGSHLCTCFVKPSLSAQFAACSA